jgi:serine/threonine protein kinase
VKEAQMLQELQGHENIVNVRGFSATHCAILLDFYSFDFAKVNIPHQPVSSLKAFLADCDEIAAFDGFEHVQFHLATDICAGLYFLHYHNIVHRDLKPDNVLVSNLFYVGCSESEVPVWWSTKPVTAVLTDFGEERSKLVQTKTVYNTYTNRLFRGSPAYMAPEATSDD